MRRFGLEKRLLVKMSSLVLHGLGSMVLACGLHTTSARSAFPAELSTSVVPKRAITVADRQQLPQSEKMVVFGVEPVDIGPGQRDAFKDLSQVEWVVPGDILRKDYSFHKETLYLATNPRPYQGGGKPNP